MHTQREIEPISSLNPYNGLVLISEIPVPLVQGLIDTNDLAEETQLSAISGSVIRLSLGSSYQMSWAHKSCALCCQPPEAEAATRKTEPWVVDNNMKLMAAAAPSYAQLSLREGILWIQRQVWSLERCRLLSPRSRVWPHQSGVIFTMCNVYWGITETEETWPGVESYYAWIIEWWMILVQFQAETFCAKSFVVARMCHESW